MASRETILCVDDEEGVLTALRQQLTARFGHECEIATAQSGKDALEYISVLEEDGERVALVIADQIMPGMKGVELLEEIHRRSPDTTKILLTGQAGLDAVIAAINRAHLNQYIPKPWAEASLRLSVENLLRQYRLSNENRQLVSDLSAKNQALLEMNRELEAKVSERTHELAEANSRLAQLAVTDGLTGLYNHRHFHERLALEVERSLRNGLPLSLLMIDVDHFKNYNDHHGHPAGDEVLRQLSHLMTDGRRANDFCARYGGEEFAIVLVDTPKLTAAKLAERLRERVAGHNFEYRRDQPGGALSISVGVATFPDDAGDSEVLVRAADSALYAAKHAGRNCVVLAGATTSSGTFSFPGDDDDHGGEVDEEETVEDPRDD
ncbi:MAG TPA: diguanylate cyclase [Kofleriaceae bacterium]|nr:diguanylate cyclase [Kofleriaceae bacterium]